MGMGMYVLDNQAAVLEPDTLKWAKWFETANRTVRSETGTVKIGGQKVGEVRISTVFLGLDHSFGGGSPLLFETIVFGGPLDQQQDRCSTWEAAEKMHEAMVERVRYATKTQAL